MENKEYNENNFKASFSGYEDEPPERVWEKLKLEMQKQPEAGSVPDRADWFSSLTKKQSRLLLLAATAIVLLFFMLVYFASNDHCAIRGHAYAGEARLCRGTAVLFLVADKASPLDSVNHSRSAMIDENGYYQFKQVKRGKYLLRIAPEENSAHAKKFLPTWFDHYTDPGESQAIVVNTEDVIADVHLVGKGEVAR